ncbi:MAG: NUDIX domain-containing protein [bacterium]|nr:NUDIX domain-containing protein [bacterium]
MTEFGEFGTCESGVEYPERLGAYGIAIRGEEILIEKARLGYFLPGGGTNEGESIEGALKREMREETGYELDSFQFIGSATEYRNGPEKGFRQKKVGHFFTVELGKKGEPTYPDGHIALVEWTAIPEVLDHLLLDSQKWAIELALSAKND